MSSTYSKYKLALIDTGTEAGQWGTITNANLGSSSAGVYQGIEQAIGGKATIDLSAGGTIALSLTDSNAAQDARALFFDLGGSPGGAVTLQVPAIQKMYVVKNGSGQTVTVEISGGTGVAVPDSSTAVVYADGTNVVTAVNYIPVLTTPNLTATTADINGGTIDGASLGATTPITSIVATTADINGGSIDGATLGTNSAITEADIDNININGNTISTTDTNGSLTLTPDGTGEVVTAKFMSGIFSDKTVALGNLGATPTLTASNGTVFTATVDQAATVTLAGSNQTANRTSSFTLVLTQGSGGPYSFDLTTNNTIYAADGALSPTSAANAIDIWFFFTFDGGTSWYVSIPIKNASSV